MPTTCSRSSHSPLSGIAVKRRIASSRKPRRDRRLGAVAQQPQRDVHADLRPPAGQQRPPAAQVGAGLASLPVQRCARRAELVVEGVDLHVARLADVTARGPASRVPAVRRRRARHAAADPAVSSSIRPGAPVAVAAVTARSFATIAARRSTRRSRLTVLYKRAVARLTACASGCSPGNESTSPSTRRQTSRSLGSIPATGFSGPFSCRNTRPVSSRAVPTPSSGVVPFTTVSGSAICASRIVRSLRVEVCENARRGLRPLPRPRADPPHRPRVRRGRGRTGRRGARPHEVLPLRDRAPARRAQPDGDPVPGGVRRWRRRHARLRARGRGAHARRLLGRDHALRAHLPGDAADLPVRLREAEARVAAAAVLR